MHLSGTSISYGPYGIQIQDKSEVKFKSVKIGFCLGSNLGEGILNMRLIHMDKYLDFVGFDIKFPSRTWMSITVEVIDLDYFRQIAPG